MPYTTLSSGLTIKVPTRGTVNWAQTMLTDTFQKISQHGHTGSGDGTKITQSALNLAAGTTRAMPPLISQIQDGSVLYGGTSGGTANAQTITLAPAITAIALGMRISFKAGASNTGAMTINPNSIGAISVKKLIGGAAYDLVEGDLHANGFYELLCDGTNFLLLNPNGPGVIFRDGTQVTYSSDGSLKTLMSTTCKANTLGPYGRLKLRAQVSCTNNTGATKQFQFRFGIGGTACGTQFSMTTSATLVNFVVEGTINNVDATNSQKVGIGAIPNRGTATVDTGGFDQTFTADTTADQTVAFQASMSDASAGFSFTVRDILLYAQ